MNTPVEDDLRSMLARRAGTVPMRTDPYDLVTQRVATDRRRRIIAAAITTALVIIAGFLSAPLASKLAAPQYSPASRPADWPTRGELAKDPGLGRYVLQSTGLRLESLHLLYAGDVGTRRYVIFRSTVQSRLGLGTLAVLTAPAGDFYDKLTEIQSLPLEPTQNAVAFVDSSTQTGRSTVFLMGPPGIDAAQYSSAPLVTADGKVTRDWDRLEQKADGVFIATRAQGEVSDLFRTRFIVDERVRADVSAQNLNQFPISVTKRVSVIAASVTAVQDVFRLNLALETLERAYIGPGSITWVAARWSDPEYPSPDNFHGLVVNLESGGAIEFVIRRGEIKSARPVAPSRAWVKIPSGKTASSWIGPDPRTSLDIPSTVGDHVPQ